MKRRACISALVLLLLTGCYKEMPVPGTEWLDTPDWTETTHGAGNAPDYDRVFPAEQVQRLDIIIDKEDWQSMWDQMTGIFGEFGRGRMVGEDHGDADYIACDLFFEGRQWYKVGIRTKGNSSIKSVWAEGRKKFPFKLDFDQFEDQYPSIRNQRFYGFRQLSLKNGFRDPSLVREKVVNDLYRDAGLPVARSAYYELYVDLGEGPVYFGLYTLVEDMDDTVLPNYFSQADGNLYKPDGNGAKFNTNNFTTDGFEVHSQGDLSDYSDVWALYLALHSTERQSNSSVWRDHLEDVFNVPGFLTWLACNTTVQNWDSYGIFSHNYYLFNHPADGRLNWISWDHNEALWAGSPQQPALDFGFSRIRDDWPLIRFLIDDPVYYQDFKADVDAFSAGVFHPDRFIVILRAELDRVTPFVEREIQPYTCLRSTQEFIQEKDRIIQHARTRYQAARSFVGG